MSKFVIDVPMPAMGATVSELTVIALAVGPGATVAKGQKLAELESDKSAFDFESPADGTIVAVLGAAGEVKHSGQPLFRMETADASLSHLAVAAAPAPNAAAPATAAGTPAPAPATPASTAAKPLVWTPRALKLAQEARLDPASAIGIEATGPGGRVSGDDVTRYLATRG